MALKETDFMIENDENFCVKTMAGLVRKCLRRGLL